jgi:hypothetical protein
MIRLTKKQVLMLHGQLIQETGGTIPQNFKWLVNGNFQGK